MSEAVTLDLTDPFDQALWEMSQLHRRKKADYAIDGTEWSNFEATASIMGIPELGTQEAIDINIGQKMARLQALRANARMDDPRNESVLDTRRDLAVYAVLSLVHASEQVTYPQEGRASDDETTVARLS